MFDLAAIQQIGMELFDLLLELASDAGDGGRLAGALRHTGRDRNGASGPA